MATVLITGAGTGFGKGAAFLLAKNHQVIAGVEIAAQIFSLEQEAKAQGLNNIRFEKLDIADPKDREKLQLGISMSWLIMQGFQKPALWSIYLRKICVNNLK